MFRLKRAKTPGSIAFPDCRDGQRFLLAYILFVAFCNSFVAQNYYATKKICSP